MRFRSKSRRPPTHNQGVLGSSPSGTTNSESKMKKSSENQRFSELFFFAHHGKIRQNKAFRVGLNIGLEKNPKKSNEKPITR